jgi:dolichyl-phosphate-mannose-protein mannosyltransferase
VIVECSKITVGDDASPMSSRDRSQACQTGFRRPLSDSLFVILQSMSPEIECKLSNYFILATALSCIFQVLWFTRTSFNFIDYDALSYIGIASHLRQGQFHVSINAFRSPLISWLIAAGSFIDGNLLVVGKLINIGSFLLSVALVYWLAKRLWQSSLVASLASFGYSLSRGLAATAVSLVSPDFLLTVLVLVYFLLLLRCLRSDRATDWVLLGGVHSLAYLAKAFALPWLALASTTAIAISVPGFSQRVKRLALAGALPLVIAAAWVAVLYSKYDVFTTGSQFKVNFIAYNARSFRQTSERFALLQDTSPEAGPGDPSFLKMDDAMVNDPMPPHSRSWKYRSATSQTLRSILAAEQRNLPGAVKEMTILLTPGGILGFVLVAWLMVQRRREFAPEFRFTVVVAVSAASLIVAYCMLVFLTTYAFPLAALIMAVSARIFVSDDRVGVSAWWRWICVGLAIAGLLVSFTYRSSPFRTLDRDFQASCRDAASKLDASAGLRVASLGSGPYPEHGVGWEAGFMAAYLANRRIVATGSLPASDQMPLWKEDIHKSGCDAVLVWGRPGDASYQFALRGLEAEYRTSVPISDPALGEVGRMVFGRLQSE